MRWIVVGAGAVGGVVGGLLADAGEDVTLVARGSQLAALQAGGLRLRTPRLDVRVRPAVVGSIAELANDAGHVVLLTVKSQDTEVV
jgi:2-dehydropantoate 2-reductase